MSCLKERGIKVVAGLSSWDVHLPAPLPAELLLVELLFDAELIEGETYMGYRWPVLLFRWTEDNVFSISKGVAKPKLPPDNRKRCCHGEINCIECMSEVILGQEEEELA